MKLGVAVAPATVMAVTAMEAAEAAEVAVGASGEADSLIALDATAMLREALDSLL